jgi:transposase
MKTTDYAALVALDWGDKTHAFACQTTGSNEKQIGQIEASAEALHGWLDKLQQTYGGRPVALAIEAGRNALFHALLEHPWLEIYPVHPTTSARFRTAFTPSGAKDDGPDAEMLLTILTLHRDQLTRLQLDGPTTRELAALVSARRSAVDHRTKNTNQLRSVLKSYFPQALELVGEDLGSALALDFLERWPELALAQKARPATLREFYAAHNVRSAERIEERIRRVASARALTSDRAWIEPALLQVAMLVALVRVQQEHVERFEQRIAAVFAAHPRAAFFRDLPGAGAALAPRLLVAFGDLLERYPDAAALQKYAGIAPVREKSGGRVWTHWRWNAPKFLRQSLVEWAGQTVVYCDWAKAFYRRHKRAGKEHHTILRSLAFKWIRILWRCWHDDTPYREQHYLDALKRRGSPLIADLAAA